VVLKTGPYESAYSHLYSQAARQRPPGSTHRRQNVQVSDTDHPTPTTCPIFARRCRPNHHQLCVRRISTVVDDRMCEQCGHASDPHVLIATTGDPSDGGIMLCPFVYCECFATWGVNGGPAKLVPDRAEIAALREQTQYPNER
jgi:hypothetical protein